MLQCCVRLSSVCRLWRYVLWLNGVSHSKSYYWQPIESRIWEIDWYHHEWWPLFRGRLRSREPLRHIRHWISWKPFGFKGLLIGNGLWGIKWSRDRWRHVTLKGQTRDPTTLNRARKYLENIWSCYLALQQSLINYYIVCCEAVQLTVGS